MGHALYSTPQDYLAFLNDLVTQERTDEALRHAPVAHRSLSDHQASPLLHRIADGTFELLSDAQPCPKRKWPVVMVSGESASAYAQWYAERTGEPWRLPGELEWEKAARGADQRRFTWGEFMDPTWCCMRDSHRGPVLPAPVEDHTLDVSPYGVRGLAGNVQDWCLEPFVEQGPDEPRIRTADVEAAWARVSQPEGGLLAAASRERGVRLTGSARDFTDRPELLLADFDDRNQA